jgi:hypothetical protein
VQRLLKDQVGDDGDEAVDELVEATSLAPRRSVSGLWSDLKLLYDIFRVCCYVAILLLFRLGKAICVARGPCN